MLVSDIDHGGQRRLCSAAMTGRPEPRTVTTYHVFIASPGDVELERHDVRRFFEKYNRVVEPSQAIRFEVIDWEHYATAGVGRPQLLITRQTLEQFGRSLVLVVGIMAQRFGTPTGEFDSGTLEEFEWALEQNRQHGWPEIKWFFRDVPVFQAPSDLNEIKEALDQWTKVQQFRKRIETSTILCKTYSNAARFLEVLRDDLDLWLSHDDRPWARVGRRPEPQHHLPPPAFYESVRRSFQHLDISGIDRNRVFTWPLSAMYVDLTCALATDFRAGSTPKGPQSSESAPSRAPSPEVMSVVAAYKRAVIVGDPGSGKSTVLKYVALALALAALNDDPKKWLDGLSIEPPPPIPLFLSCWDLHDSLARNERSGESAFLNELVARAEAFGFRSSAVAFESLLQAGDVWLLFDGLDEVGSEEGRMLLSGLIDGLAERFTQARITVTCRIRAYSGDTMLKSPFDHFQLEPFSAAAREMFLHNWFAALYDIPAERVLDEHSASRHDFLSLKEAIERSARIGALAINPLLLTVLAIVHSSRKRLPEQRVDLYDECVDVLLGQRKDAERVLASRRSGRISMAPPVDSRRLDRRRFGQIALDLQLAVAEEGNRERLVKLLAPSFLRDGRTTTEESEIFALEFLQKQELQSGLLVSRRPGSYRFFHLTFQEYLAAWHLAESHDFPGIDLLVSPHLVEPAWFETLELLGAQLPEAKLDAFLKLLAGKKSEVASEQAQIGALCAKVLEDVEDRTYVLPATRKLCEEAIRATLGAFDETAKVPVKVQLELLDALGQLGDVGKYLSRACQSGHLQVRLRAFRLMHKGGFRERIFETAGATWKGFRASPWDSSQLVEVLFATDVARAARFVESRFDDGADHALLRALPRLEALGIAPSSEWLLDLLQKFGRDNSVHVGFLHWTLSSLGPEKLMSIARVSRTLPRSVRRAVIQRLGDLPVPHQGRWRVLLHGLTDPDAEVRATTLWCLVRNSQGLSVFGHVNVVLGRLAQLVWRLAVRDPSPKVRRAALCYLAGSESASVVSGIVNEVLKQEDDGLVLSVALDALAEVCAEVDGTWTCLVGLAADETSSTVRIAAMDALARSSSIALDEAWLKPLILTGSNALVWRYRVRLSRWCLPTHDWGLDEVEHHPRLEFMRVSALCGLGVSTLEDEQYLRGVATGDEYTLARMLALSTLAHGALSSPWPLIQARAISDEDSRMRSFAATLLVNASTEDHETRVELLRALSEADSAERHRLLEAVATNIPCDVEDG